MKRPLLQPEFSDTSSPSSSANSTASTPSSAKWVPLRSKNDVKQAFSQSHGALKEFLLDGICCDDEFIWLLIKLKPERLHLQNCTFDPKGPDDFGHIFKFLTYRNLSKPCFRLLVQFDGFTAQWILHNGFSAQRLIDNEQIDSLLFILPGNIFQRPWLSDISSLVFVQPKSDLGKPLSSQFKESLNLMMKSQCPKLKRLLFWGINFDGGIEDFMDISQVKWDLIYLWNCAFQTRNLIWYASMESEKLIKSIHTGEIQGFQFDIPINGHTIQIVFHGYSPLLMPDSPELVHGLIPPSELGLLNDPLLDNISLLILLPSKHGPSNGKLTSQDKKHLKSMMNRLRPKLKYLLLIDMDFDDNIEDSIPIPQLNLDLIYVWNCGFETNDPIWLALCDFVKLVDPMFGKNVQSCQFAIPINGHITRILINKDSHFVSRPSDIMVHGLVLYLGQNLPDALFSDNVSFIIFLPSETGSNKSISAQSKQSLKSIKNTQCPKLKYLFLKNVSLNNIEENFGSIGQLGLEMCSL